MIGVFSFLIARFPVHNSGLRRVVCYGIYIRISGLVSPGPSVSFTDSQRILDSFCPSPVHQSTMRQVPHVAEHTVISDHRSLACAIAFVFGMGADVRENYL